jgi:hypothetical protein
VKKNYSCETLGGATILKIPLDMRDFQCKSEDLLTHPKRGTSWEGYRTRPLSVSSTNAKPTSYQSGDAPDIDPFRIVFHLSFLEIGCINVSIPSQAYFSAVNRIFSEKSSHARYVLRNLPLFTNDEHQRPTILVT